MSIKIALAGNPNSGKTTLFNALTGSNQFVGNWPGVTVEKKEGKLKQHPEVTVTDLPGIYSLSPYTMEEVVARNYLIDEDPDVILNIVDGMNLERNLYLTTQLTELGIPVVIAINMMDLVNKIGDKINIDKLSRAMGCKVVSVSALKGTGIMEAAEAAIEAAASGKIEPPHCFSGPVEHALAHIEEAAVHDMDDTRQRWYAIKIFERDKKVIESLGIPEDKLAHIEKDISRAEAELDDDSEAIIANERYNYICSITNTFYKRNANSARSVSEKIDRVVTNRILALPILALVMFFVYFVAMSAFGGRMSDWTNDRLFGDGFNFFGRHVDGIPDLVSRFMDHIGAGEFAKGLVVKGIIGGVGAVLGFVPQMFLLFFLLAFLEACGYMSRVAFMLDRVFRKFGLSGKSFIPLLVASGCGVPGIMATRTIESQRDRRMTIMTTTFIPCGAKFPIIAFITSALFRHTWLHGSWLAPLAYIIGIASVVVSGMILKKTGLFAGDPAPFVMELPAYHMPTLKNLLRSMWERGWSFIKKAGTVILIASIVVWLGSVFGNTGSGFGFDADMELESSILGYVGRGIRWIFIPLGFGTSKAAIATTMGILAKEEVVGVFGVLGFEGYSRLAGISFLVFNLLCAPCCAAIAAIRQEMGSARWTLIAIGYQCGFAYAISLMIYQFGMAAKGSADVPGLIFAMGLLFFLLFMIVRPARKINGDRT